jgi:NAD(P)-dependent dehydrogenase (short-subunit alcohol dehydrogenase family)
MASASMSGKTVVVTGASSGIGYETTRELAKRGARVLMVVRNRERGQAAIDRIVASHPMRSSTSCSPICTRSPKCAAPQPRSARTHLGSMC